MADPRDQALRWLPDGLVLLAPDGAVIDVNECFLAMTGLDPDALLGRRTLFPDWPADEAPRLAAAFADCERTGAAECDVTLPRADGGSFPAIVSVAPVRGAGGALEAHVVTVKDVTARVRAEQARAALGRVGAAVAVGAPAATVVERVVDELERLAPGARASVERGTGAGATAGRVTLDGSCWGLVRISAAAGPALPTGLDDVLDGMAGLVSEALEGERARSLELARAGADPVVALPDARAFADLAGREFERAARYGHEVALVLVDIDDFRRVNEEHGQAAGDAVLREMAARLGARVRGCDWLGRTGGDEFAWMLPETGESAAHDAAARLRRALAEEPFAGVGYLTVSIGIATGASAEDGADLYRQAEVALHWAKVSGRNRTVRYTFEVAEEVFRRRGAEQAETPSLRAMRALAWAVDAKDPHTHRHSARVADLAVQLATALGWPLTRAAQLREAGLVHDVGKIAVPDAILFKPGPLTRDEARQMASHPDVGARIVADVLSAEQAGWVRAHHERWDGGGYPDGLAGEEIPEEARLITLADCWDVIVSARSYKLGRTVAEAMDEVRRCSGTQFWPVAVEALERLVAAGVVRDAPDAAEGAPGALGTESAPALTA